ncbi:unnamed protein product [Allacma fusca]|uniref:Uncharacterized protein n=1 Tax=Allacma fusca TaxID=39272 RepID=A0A8J2K2F8_9HEXA|nr:unnamed protein product [Allacma fusca]
MVSYKYTRTSGSSVVVDIPVTRRKNGERDALAAGTYTADGQQPTANQNPGSINNSVNVNNNWFCCNSFGIGSERNGPDISSMGWFIQTVCVIICGGLLCCVAILAGIAFKSFN